MIVALEDGRYGMSVARVVAVLPTAAVVSLVGVCSANVSNASPPDEGKLECSYVLTPPKVVQVSDTSMVVASVRPGRCTMVAVPNESLVCLAVEGEGSNGQCVTHHGSFPAEVHAPYRPGATYVVTGKGCADLFVDPATGDNHAPSTVICQSFGPTSFKL